MDRLCLKSRWVTLPGFTGYEISDQAQIRNRHGKILKQQVATRGYLKITLGKATRLVHKLVLLAFVGPSDEPITFRNRNRQDCRLANLCYGEEEHAKVGITCSKGHELVGENVTTWGSNRICVACRDGKPAPRLLPEIL